MGKPHPIELHARVVAFVEEGNSNREAARHFRVSPRFVNNMMILHRSSRSLAAARQGHPLGSKLSPYRGQNKNCSPRHAAFINQRQQIRCDIALYMRFYGRF